MRSFVLNAMKDSRGQQIGSELKLLKNCRIFNVKQKHGNKKTNQKSGDFFMLVQKLHFILIDNPI